MQEVPHVFYYHHGTKLANNLKIFLGGGMSAKFKFGFAEKKIYGMNQFLRKYVVREGYIMFFKYCGNSDFQISVYDTACVNHLRHCCGTYRFEDFMFPSCSEEVIEIDDSFDVKS